MFRSGELTQEACVSRGLRAAHLPTAGSEALTPGRNWVPRRMRPEGLRTTCSLTRGCALEDRFAEGRWGRTFVLRSWRGERVGSALLAGVHLSSQSAVT